MSHSALETAGQRFLSLALQQALEDGWLTADDFVTTFSPDAVMSALEKAPELRASVLVGAAGVHERIAPKKSTTAAAEDLRIALAEGVCTPALLLELFALDDRVRYSSNDELWALYVRDGFWTQSSERARLRMRLLLSTALEQGLIRLGEIIESVSALRLASDLPKPLLEKALVRAIENGRAGAPFDAEALFDTLPLEDWVAHVPLPLLWEQVVTSRVLPATGVLTLAAPAPAAPAPPVPAPPAPAPPAEEATAEAGTPASRPTPHPASETEARSRATENLKRLDRLPPRLDELHTPTLLAIDGMYADLLATTDDEERAQIIRDAFPNAQMLEQALFAVAEALDPRLNAEALRARGAEGEALITLVLFEERRRQSGRPSGFAGSPSRPPGPVNSPAPPLASEEPGATHRPSSVPPPLPQNTAKRSVPPPPLPAQAGRRGR
ncbi:MAG TPA: hypothetical protein VLC09_08630 [Polyangiaceae bacterium]|nr:hypothetical protein [Polyangiaceae bacterium]